MKRTRPDICQFFVHHQTIWACKKYINNVYIRKKEPKLAEKSQNRQNLAFSLQKKVHHHLLEKSTPSPAMTSWQKLATYELICMRSVDSRASTQLSSLWWSHKNLHISIALSSTTPSSSGRRVPFCGRRKDICSYKMLFGKYHHHRRYHHQGDEWPFADVITQRQRSQVSAPVVSDRVCVCTF